MHVPASSTALNARGLRVGVAISRYHEEVVVQLREGARSAYLELGGALEDLVELDAPGAFELPVIAAALADREEIDAVVALGCIIAGETHHDRVIAHAVAQGLTHLSLESRTPVGFGVLTCDTIAQALARAGGGKGNKGADAMRAAVAAACGLRALAQMRFPRRSGR